MLLDKIVLMSGLPHSPAALWGRMLTLCNVETRAGENVHRQTGHFRHHCSCGRCCRICLMASLRCSKLFRSLCENNNNNKKIGANGKQRASRPGLCKEERAGAGGHDGSHKYQAGPFIQRISAEFPTAMKWGWGKKMPYLKLWRGTLCIEVILFHFLLSDACGLHHLVCVLNL